MNLAPIKNELNYKWSVPIKATIKQVWPYISDTERTNRAINEPTVTYEEKPNPLGGSTRYGRYSRNGINFFWLENPYEWVVNQFIQVERNYFKGVFKRFFIQIQLEDQGESVIFHQNIRIVLNNLFFRSIFRLVVKGVIKKFKALGKSLEQIIQNSDPIGIVPYDYVQNSLDKKKFQSIYEKFQNLSNDTEMISSLTKYILDAPDLDLLKIRPYRVAKKLKLDKYQTLDFFLNGTKQGHFEMNWDLLCPSCRGAKYSSNSLKDLEMNIHCDSCNIDYTVEFDESVEITFSPHPNIREIQSGIFCIGGPGNTPHIIVQLRISPLSEKCFELDLKEGKYRCYSPQLKKEILIEVSNGNEVDENLEMQSVGEETQKNKIFLKPGHKKFKFQNPFPDHEILVRVERTAWLEDIVTAAEVTSLQKFRDMFSSEVLRPGQEISVKSMCFFFTDLKGSTMFYNDSGDANAFKRVMDHFEILTNEISKNKGTIVKTIGDAVMATFLNPVDALKAAIHSHYSLNEANKKFDEKIVLKIGLHNGHALAVNLNDRLDFFGRTVNLAARTEGQCDGNDIVITETVFKSAGIQDLIRDYGIPFEKFESTLKGFKDVSILYRLRLG